jgi:hypothetical protein
MENSLLYIMILLLIVNIIVSSYTLSKVTKTKEKYDPDGPYDPDDGPYYPRTVDPQRCKDRYNYCIQHRVGGDGADGDNYCKGWAGYGCSVYL